MEDTCTECGGEGTIITDTYDHNGEHVQREEKCICKLEEREYDDEVLQ